MKYHQQCREERNPGRIHSTHGIVGVVGRVTFDSTLHGDAAIEHNIDEWRDVTGAGAEYSPRE